MKTQCAERCMSATRNLGLVNFSMGLLFLFITCPMGM